VCVLEISAALHGLNLDWIKAFFAKRGLRTFHFHTNPAATAHFIQAVKDSAHSTVKPSLIWIE
jgi:hypothetical protein